jgi:hypothetical protein
MTTYFVSSAGSDSNNGTTTGTPWQTITKVNAGVYNGGDTISFAGGQSFTGGIVMGSSGATVAQTWNPSQINSDITLSNGNLTATHTAITSEDSPGYALNGYSTGKFYWETVVNGGTDVAVGIGTTATPVGSAGSQYLGNDTTSVGYHQSGNVVNNNALTGTAWATYSSGSRICHALDLTNGKYWTRVGTTGNWNNNAAGDPTNSASAGNFSIPAGVTGLVVPGFNTKVQTSDFVVAYFSSASWVGTPPAGFGSTDKSGTSNWGSSPAPTSGTPVTFQSYGTGAATISSGSADGISAINLPGLAIGNLNFTGNGITSNSADGIHIENSQAGSTQLSGPAITNCVVTAYGGFGILVWGSNGNSGFDTVNIVGCTASNNTGNKINVGVSGIAVYSDAGYVSGTPCFGTVNITNCVASDNIGTASGTHWTGGGIVVGEANQVNITGCFSSYNGTSGIGGNVGIMVYDSNNYHVSKCESTHNSRGSGTHDGDGFNCDTNSSGSGLIELCYAHGNDGFGFLFDTYIGINKATMRFCISQNNNDAGITNGAEIGLSNYGGNTFGVKLTCINNTIYSANSIFMLVDGTSWANITGTIANNIFYSASGGEYTYYGAAAASGAPASLIFDGNDYHSDGTFSLNWNGTNYTSLAAWKAAFSAQEPHSGSFSTANPFLVNPGGGLITGGYVPSSLTAYQLQPGSPMIGVGLNLNSLYSINPGTQDFFGVSIPYATGFNVGAGGVLQGAPKGGMLLFGGFVGWASLLGAGLWKVGKALYRNATRNRRRFLTARW